MTRPGGLRVSLALRLAGQPGRNTTHWRQSQRLRVSLSKTLARGSNKHKIKHSIAHIFLVLKIKEARATAGALHDRAGSFPREPGRKPQAAGSFVPVPDRPGPLSFRFRLVYESCAKAAAEDGGRGFGGRTRIIGLGSPPLSRTARAGQTIAAKTAASKIMVGPGGYDGGSGLGRVRRRGVPGERRRWWCSG